MRSTALKIALLSLVVSGGVAEAQVNLIQKPHHVYIKPKPAEQPSTSAAAAPPAPTAPAATAPAAPAAPAQSASTAAPTTPQP